MTDQAPGNEQLLAEVEELRARLAEAEETLRAIRSGEVDALVVAGPHGDRVFTLTSAEQPYRVFIEEMNEGAVTLSEDGLILYCNGRMAEMLKTPLEQVIGALFRSFVTPADRPAFHALLQAGRDGRGAGEVLVRAGDGIATPVRLSMTGSPGGPVSAVVTDLTESKRHEHELLRAHDELEQRVTERTAALVETNLKLAESREAALDFMATAVEARRAAEEATDELRREIAEREQLEEQVRQSQKIEAIGRLAGGIAHEFNNMLASILGNTHLALADAPPDHPLRECLDEIWKAGVRARNLVQQILAFSRQQPQERRVVALGSLIDEAIALLRPAIPATAELVASVGPGVPPVLADPTQIRQVLVNLCTNAWRALDGRPGRIEIRLDPWHVDDALRQSHPELRPGTYVCLSVSDTGKGIDEAVMENIFEPFFTTEATGDGTGLGLSVAHGIVRSHGGTITVESEPGRGSTFRVYLPPSAETAAPAIVEPSRPAEVRGGENILYLDDEEALVFLASRFLRRLGYRVSGHTETSTALAAFAENPEAFDLVIVDFNLPGASGVEVARQLKSIRADAPVVLISGYLRQQDIEQARAVGISDVILKPNAVEELGPAVQRLLPRDGGAPG